MDTRKRILILSHQGKSFIDKLANVSKSLGLQPIVLSSDTSKIITEQHKIVSKPSLQFKDVTTFLNELEAIGVKPSACITVWEGYRSIMAQINSVLGANDLDHNLVNVLRDKFHLRKRLLSNNLSNAQTFRICSKKIFQKLKKRKDLFLKPRTGAGSFGAFRWTDDVTYSDLQNLVVDMKNDRDYDGIFNGQFEFIAESFITGNEFSAELILDRNEIKVAVFHEKVEVQATDRTTLENSCVCPPITVDAFELKKGYLYLQKCLTTLGLTTGCFHIELKYDRNARSWDLIEINPRVGGALIKESTEIASAVDAYSLIG